MEYIAVEEDTRELGGMKTTCIHATSTRVQTPQRNRQKSATSARNCDTLIAIALILTTTQTRPCIYVQANAAHICHLLGVVHGRRVEVERRREATGLNLNREE